MFMFKYVLHTYSLFLLIYINLYVKKICNKKEGNREIRCTCTTIYTIISDLIFLTTNQVFPSGSVNRTPVLHVRLLVPAVFVYGNK